jgi:hypothetical protein
MVGDVPNLVVPGKMLKRGQPSCKVGGGGVGHTSPGFERKEKVEENTRFSTECTCSLRDEGMSNAHNLKLSSVNLFLMDSS